MSSSWPVVLGIFAVVVGAFWYDASFTSANALPIATQTPTMQVR